MSGAGEDAYQNLSALKPGSVPLMAGYTTEPNPPIPKTGPEVYEMARAQTVQILWTSQLSQGFTFRQQHITNVVDKHGGGP